MTSNTFIKIYIMLLSIYLMLFILISLDAYSKHLKRKRIKKLIINGIQRGITTYDDLENLKTTERLSRKQFDLVMCELKRDIDFSNDEELSKLKNKLDQLFLHHKSLSPFGDIPDNISECLQDIMRNSNISIGDINALTDKIKTNIRKTKKINIILNIIAISSFIIGIISLFGLK